MNTSVQRVTVALSGGVDSSVAALLLKRAGYRVEGVFMRNWHEAPETEREEGCAQVALDAQDAYSVAASLGIPVRTLDFSADYRERVFLPFIEEYRAGRTPNPDILCNSEIKFRAFLDHAMQTGADRVATGHYARLGERDGRIELLTGCDADKDQTYFLHRLDQGQLAHLLFPLGEMDKKTVRALAAEAGLITCDKKDSAGICFIGERRFRRFLERYLPQREGEIRSPEGRRLGHHRGAWFYTIGQRRDLGIGGQSDCPEGAWYIADKDTKRNVIYAVQGAGHPLLHSQELLTEPPHWIAGAPPALPLRCLTRIRHRQRPQACTIAASEAGGCRVRFERPQRAIAPGQSVVFYRGPACLGGAVIAAAVRRPAETGERLYEQQF